MPPTREFLQVLAEAVAPLSHSLAAGLLIRPVRPASSGDGPAYALAQLCAELEAALGEHVPAMQDAMAEMATCTQEELEELVDELAAPALELVDMARRIWADPFPPGAEAARPLLATLAEAPVTQLLQWVLEVMHLSIDPWSLSDNPEQPDPGFALTVPDKPVREALEQWKTAHPGFIPDEALR